MTVFQSFSKPQAGSPQEVDLFAASSSEVDADRIAKVEFTDAAAAGGITVLNFERTDGSKGVSFGPYDRDLVNDLVNHKVEIDQAKPDNGAVVLGDPAQLPAVRCCSSASSSTSCARCSRAAARAR